MIKLPLLTSKSKTCLYPPSESPLDAQGCPRLIKCPICGADFRKSGFAFLAGGGRFCDRKGNSLILDKTSFIRSGLHFGYHGSENVNSPFRKGKVEGYKTQNIVDDCLSEEFSINFCSIHCMRNWFNSIFDEFVLEFREEFGYDP